MAPHQHEIALFDVSPFHSVAEAHKNKSRQAWHSSVFAALLDNQSLKLSNTGPG